MKEAVLVRILPRKAAPPPVISDPVHTEDSPTWVRKCSLVCQPSSFDCDSIYKTARWQSFSQPHISVLAKMIGSDISIPRLTFPTHSLIITVSISCGLNIQARMLTWAAMLDENNDDDYDDNKE